MNHKSYCVSLIKIIYSHADIYEQTYRHLNHTCMLCTGCFFKKLRNSFVFIIIWSIYNNVHEIFKFFPCIILLW